MEDKEAESTHRAGMPRRDFVRGIAAIPALSAALGASQAPATSGSRFVAIQVAANTLLDEGIDRCLDLMQECAAINVVVVQSHTY